MENANAQLGVISAYTYMCGYEMLFISIWPAICDRNQWNQLLFQMQTIDDGPSRIKHIEWLLLKLYLRVIFHSFQMGKLFNLINEAS